VSAEAWPYAVTRGQLTGYQAILVPGFLADAELTFVLEYASRQETDEPGTATVREVLGAAQTLSLAYRVSEVRGDRYGLGGEEVLEDLNGRPIRVFEGLVLRLPAPEVVSLGLTTRDLDAVTRLAAPPFRTLWKAETRIEAEPSAPRRVGKADPAAWPLNMQIARPYVIPDSVSKPPWPEDHEPGPPPPPPPPPPRVPKGLITVAAAVGALALVGWLLSQLFSSSPSPNGNQLAATTIVTQLCHDLSSGKAGHAFGDLSTAYRHSTSQAAFATSLLGSNSSAKCTSETVSRAGDRAKVVLQRADGSRKTAHLTFREESNQWQATGMSVSS
jgi:hypothetical protein